MSYSTYTKCGTSIRPSAVLTKVAAVAQGLNVLSVLIPERQRLHVVHVNHVREGSDMVGSNMEDDPDQG